jgi:hypothetical protein
VTATQFPNPAPKTDWATLHDLNFTSQPLGIGGDGSVVYQDNLPATIGADSTIRTPHSQASREQRSIRR